MGSGLRFGIDLVEVARFARALQRWPRLGDRIFAPDEEHQLGPSRLAGRFAAKEAAFKAIGDGWPAISYHDVIVARGPRGRPTLALRGAAGEAVEGSAVEVSITHSGGFAVAGVVLLEEGT